MEKYVRRREDMEKEEENIVKQGDKSSPGFGAYSPEAGYGLDLSSERREAEFQDNNKRQWKDSVAGRGAIRLFSRGALGAAAFTWGTYYAGAKMRRYNPHASPKNFVQGIAKAYDIVFGTPIKGLVNALGHDGEKFLTFRPTLDGWSGYSGKMGRSLGHEVVGVTFDFASMSVGDFWGRKIADTLDPNVKKDWVNENGGINYTKAATRFGYNWWTALTYAAGEDWAVGVPYVLTMRHIGTPLINKAFPGYAMDFDRNGAGGSLLVNDHGRIRSNFTTAGVFNLWERFTTYNIGTLLFRETYTWTANRLKHIWEHGERAPLVPFNPDNPDRTMPEAVVDGAKDLGLWASRNAVKATMYMLPAVPFFWLSRVPQHKYRGYFIHPEKGILKYMSGTEEMALRVHTQQLDPHFTPKTPVFFSNTHEAAANPFASGSFDPHAKTYGLLDWLLAPIGRLSDRLRRKSHPFGRWLDKHPDIAYDLAGLELDVSPLGRKKLLSGRAVANTYVNAAVAYAPYFWAKSDLFAHAWDSGRTDVAIERTLKGLGMLNVPEAGKGITEIGYALRGEALPDPQREAEAQLRIETKLTPPDSSYDISPIAARHEQAEEQAESPINTQGFAERLRDHKQQANDRMAKFKQQQRPASYAQAVEEAALRAPTYAEQERIRKEAANATPPGPDVTVH